MKTIIATLPMIQTSSNLAAAMFEGVRQKEGSPVHQSVDTRASASQPWKTVPQTMRCLYLYLQKGTDNSWGGLLKVHSRRDGIL